MTDILILGAAGKMGGQVLSLLRNDKDAHAVCGVDKYPAELDIPVYKDFSEVREPADVIVDFSSAENLKERLDYAADHKMGIVLATTGFTEEDLRLIDEYSEKLPFSARPTSPSASI